MKTSELHTLEEVLTTGVKVDGLSDPIEVSCVFIPKIQRAYAQGRESETDVRNDFLDALFEVLVSEEEKSIELSFLFGSKQPMVKRKGEGFELLDGQQRTTTLFLLYWYMGMKENGTAPKFLSKFTYETRNTSIQFLDNITSESFRVDLEESTPSKAIKDNKWFTDDFYCDPTVCAMLNMLDAIDKKYKTAGHDNLYGRLNRLRFYVLMLEKFDMNDELYIKMNSRGLSLVPFENFKASVIKFMKAKERDGKYGTDTVVGGQKPFWLDFASKIDAQWIDLFWKCENGSDEECNEIISIDDKLIGIRYLNFFNRYLFTKAALKDDMKNNKANALSNFFYNDAEGSKMKERFFGWKKYEEMFLSDEDYLRSLGKVLDVMRENWESFIKGTIKADPFKNVEDFDICNSEMSRYHRVVFAATTEFIEHIPDGYSFNDNVVQENYMRLLRVVFNIIENTPIESIEPIIRTIKACGEIISAEGAVTGNFYHSLAKGEFRSGNRQLKEEVVKAKEMFDDIDNVQTFDKSWEDVFKTAEEHPFFRGSVLFFFTPGAGTSSDYSDRYNVVKDLFDKNGISSEYRKNNHLLIRAMLGQINYWKGGLEDRYVTEDSEKEKFLKMLLTTQEVRTMMCKYFDNGSKQSFVDYLDDVVKNATSRTGEHPDFSRLFARIVNDSKSPALFDWIHSVERAKTGKEERKKRFRIQYNRNAFLIGIPGTWHDRIILDTERHLIIPKLIADYSMTYVDKNQEKMMEGPVGDAFGWDVDISGKIGDYRLKLSFNVGKWADFYVYGTDTEAISKHFGIVDPTRKDDKKVKVSIMRYQLFKDIDDIKGEIDRIISEMKVL